MTDKCPLVSRRQFIAGLGATVAVASCGGKGVTVYQRNESTTSTSLVPGVTNSPRSTMPVQTIPTTDKTLVVIELGGGNDTLSTIVPLSSRYRDLRPTTAVEDPIEIDSEIGLHPQLTTVAERYQAGQVAIVEGLGIDQPDLSHFVSMRRWWDGTDQPDHTGWLGRYLDGAVGYDHVLGGISVGPSPSPAMLGTGSFVVGIADADGLASGFPWWVDDARDFAGVWSGFAPADVPLSELDPVRRAIATTADAQQRLQDSIEPLQATLEAADVWTGSLEGQLALAGGLVASGVDPRIVYVHGSVDLDTHEDQMYRHADVMGELDRGLRHFFEIVDGAGVSDRVTVMTTSEFGRRPDDNDGGTDHGTASSHFVIGSQVSGGRYGEPASLTRFDADGNFIHNVDFRSMYATMLTSWLGAGHEDLLDDSFELLPVFV